MQNLDIQRRELGQTLYLQLLLPSKPLPIHRAGYGRYAKSHVICISKNEPTLKKNNQIFKKRKLELATLQKQAPKWVPLHCKLKTQ